jgi:DNA repair exonuclease SbcCD ATPase subunit
MHEVVLYALIMVLAATAWAQETNVVSATNDVSSTGPEKIRHLEQKASDRDLLAIKIKQLEAAVVQARREEGQIKAASSSTRLQEIERRAQSYDALLDQIEKKNNELSKLEERLAEDDRQIKSLEDQVASFQSNTNVIASVIQTEAEKEKKLRATIEQLLLGNFEYYEVKRGDTLEGIAKKPMIYGEDSKAEWLRQANEGRVKDINNLREGEMIVIPRFPMNGLFSF